MLQRHMRHRAPSASTRRLRAAGIAAGLLLAGVSATASAVDKYLAGSTSLPFPVRPTDRSIAV